MPDKSDRKIISISSLHNEAPALSDLSPRDEPWDKHRSNAGKVSEHYAGSEFHKYTERISNCSELLDFKLVPGEDSYVLKLSAALFCRVRQCPVC